MADVLSSNSSEEDDAVTNPIQLAINKGANITEPDRAAISRKRKIVKNSGKYKASHVKNHSKNDTCVWDRLKDFPGQHLYCKYKNIRATFFTLSNFSKFWSNFLTYFEQLFRNLVAQSGCAYP